MADENHEFSLSAAESGDLEELLSSDGAIARLLRFQKGADGRVAIRLSRDEIEILRDYLTTQMALRGFDENYQPNEKGQMLEKFIDKFFVP